MGAPEALAAAWAVPLAAVHLFAGQLRFIAPLPRSRWLSLAGGVAVAYVFVHVFPELEQAGEAFGEQQVASVALEHVEYVLALAGLAVFYGLERAVKRTRGRGRAAVGEEWTRDGVFWLHIGSFAAYNALVGYLLASEGSAGRDRGALLLFTLALGLHFLSNDYGLQSDHQQAYQRVARWVLAVAVLGGALLRLAVAVPEAWLLALFAFLAGGIVLNSLKEELPEERESDFWAFALGAAAFTALLLRAE